MDTNLQLEQLHRTKSSTNIDKASKTITINGDFVTGDAITIEDIENQ